MFRAFQKIQPEGLLYVRNMKKVHFTSYQGCWNWGAGVCKHAIIFSVNFLSYYVQNYLTKCYSWGVKWFSPHILDTVDLAIKVDPGSHACTSTFEIAVVSS